MWAEWAKVVEMHTEGCEASVRVVHVILDGWTAWLGRTTLDSELTPHRQRNIGAGWNFTIWFWVQVPFSWTYALASLLNEVSYYWAQLRTFGVFRYCTALSTPKENLLYGAATKEPVLQIWKYFLGTRGDKATWFHLKDPHAVRTSPKGRTSNWYTCLREVNLKEQLFLGLKLTQPWALRRLGADGRTGVYLCNFKSFHLQNMFNKCLTHLCQSGCVVVFVCIVISCVCCFCQRHGEKDKVIEMKGRVNNPAEV